VKDNKTAEKEVDQDEQEKAEAKLKKREQSVLQAKLTKLAIQIGYVGMTIAICTVIVLIVRYCITEYGYKKSRFSMAILQPLVKYLITGITVLVVAVPEGLPLAVTISLAYAVKVIY
jgi:P-type Ca2+ transporter type 2B